ncbi:MAG: DUF1570 domain-containing protein [Planctomycetota bacterium]|nr:DUF1570 domain-containing protein [Planctomycetota bacterium]
MNTPHPEGPEVPEVNVSLRPLRVAAATGALFLLLGGPAPADRLITTDGRILDVVKARELPDGGYRLVFQSGEIHCSAEHVASVEIEGDMSDYVPQNDDEKQKLARGFVRYRGKWLSKPAYRSQLNKQAQESRKRTEELAAHANFSNAWEKETKHFVIRTNTSPELLEFYDELLEGFYKLMDDRIGIKPTPTLKRTKMVVNIYKSHDEFLSYNPEMSRSVLGFFSSTDQTLNFFHDYQEPSRSTWVALHECTHLLTYLIEQQYLHQIWMNEAVADYFGSSEFTKDKRGRLVIVPGKIQVDRILTVQQAIKDGKDIRLEKLFLIDRNSFQGFQYAHAWSFVFFLNEANPKYAKAFNKFFKDLYTLKLKGVRAETINTGLYDKLGMRKRYKPEDIRDQLLKRLGTDIDSLEKEWKDFIAGTEIDAPEARFKRGYNVVRGGRREEFDQAKEDLDFAIENGITDPRAFRARGLLKLYTGKAAEEDLRRAVELAPLLAIFHYDLGRVLSRSFSPATSASDKGGRELIGTDEELQEALEHFGLAMELDRKNDLYSESYEGFRAALEKRKTQ